MTVSPVNEASLAAMLAKMLQDVTSAGTRIKNLEQTPAPRLSSVLLSSATCLRLYADLEMELKSLNERFDWLQSSVLSNPLSPNSDISERYGKLIAKKKDSLGSASPASSTARRSWTLSKEETSAAISCVKPSGTVSQLVNSRSGMHGGHSRYYIRTIRADIKDPLTSFLIEAGVPNEVDVMNPNTIIFSFPKEAPAETVMRDDWDAIKNLEFWKFLQENWCEHKPSVTISVKDDEWMKVGAWVYENFDILSGVSFLPYDGGSYKQAPYQEIT
jgi:hypothetical protein